MIEPSAQELEHLRQIYRESSRQLSSLLGTTEFQTGKASALLKQVDRISKELGMRTDRWVTPATRTIMHEAADQTVESLKAGGLEIGGSFNQINERAVRVFSGQMARDLAGANKHAADETRRIIRRTQQMVLKDSEISKVLAKGLIAGGNLNKIANSLKDRLAEGGKELLSTGKMTAGQLEKIVDLDAGYIQAGSRRMEIGEYAYMVADTQLRTAVTQATIDRLGQAGEELGEPDLFDLVIVEGRTDGCNICDEYVGRVFSLSGRTEGYMVLPARTPFHPNCTHFLAPYVDLISKSAVAARAASNQALFAQWRAKGSPGSQ